MYLDHLKCFQQCSNREICKLIQRNGAFYLVACRHNFRGCRRWFMSDDADTNEEGSLRTWLNITWTRIRNCLRQLFLSARRHNKTFKTLHHPWTFLIWLNNSNDPTLLHDIIKLLLLFSLFWLMANGRNYIQCIEYIWIIKCCTSNSVCGITEFPYGFCKDVMMYFDLIWFLVWLAKTWHTVHLSIIYSAINFPEIFWEKCGTILIYC